MYLKSLELHGFKSFPDKTVLQFNQGTTIIVGPNGSGKSNITDAMRWVLGELSSKSLRGSKMEDVIFSGADGVRPMGFAEVSITFDNSEEPKTIPSEYDEITVTRRYYRAGDSAYFINRKPVRLKDIYELFMNTGVGREGYSIIGQGRIAEIISKKSEDRRTIFEEAAGITKYRYRKNESQKKLAETEANMTRVGDIAAELESRIGPLERDAAKARTYLELYGEKKNLDVSVWKFDMDKHRGELEKFESETKMSAHELEMADDTARQLEEQIERAYENSHANREAAQKVLDDITAARSTRSKLESDVKVIENNTLHAKEKLEREKKNKADAEELLESLRKKLDTLGDETEKLNGQITESDENCKKIASNRAETIEKRNGFDDEIEELLRARQKSEGEIGDLRVRLNVLKNSISEGTERRDGIDAELASYKKEIEGLEKSIHDAEKTVSDYEHTVKAESDKYDEASRLAAEISDEREVLREKLSSTSAQSEATASRITALERMMEHFDGYNNSVRFVMNEASAGRLSGILGPLSHLIKVDGKYAIALETSFGAALQNIVTSDEKSAKAAISALKSAGAGRATFCPVTTVKAQERNAELESAKTCRGFVGFADELVGCEAKYREVVKSVVGRIAVFDTLDNASDMARARGWRVRAVTLDGQQINAGGSFTGGSARHDSGMLTRTSQIDSMREDKKKLDREAAELNEKIEKLTEKLTLATGDAADADEKRRLIESLANVEKTGLGELEAKRELVTGLIAKLEEDISKFDESRERSTEDIKNLEGLIEKAEAELSELIAKREAAAGERGELDVTADELTVALSEAQIRHAELQKDREALNLSIAETNARGVELKEEIIRRDGEIARLTEDISGAAGKSEALLREGEEKDTLIVSLEEQRRRLDEEGDRIETSLNDLRRREKEHSNKKELLFITHTKNENKLEGLRADIDKMTSRLWDEYELTYNGAVEYAEEAELEEVTQANRHAINARLSELKTKIKSLGNVNVGAIEEYAETKERYDSIKVQMDDLEASKTELEGIIGEIENDMRRMFSEAFSTINRNFGEVFRDLFGGGSAELSLTDPDDVLSSGIEISAAPPGKTIKSLSLLSGGEQAFIAIALMFALIRYSPSPFCIFDEIEAALDEVNVTRVANYVKRFSREMQIIMITHRRGTMDIADTLYGVTMPRRGISKVFTLDVNASEENDEFLK